MNIKYAVYSVFYSFFTTVLLLSYVPAMALELPGVLVDTNWLAEHGKEVVLLDVRKTVVKDSPRIPNATLVPWGKVRAKKHEDGMDLIKMLPRKQDFEKLMQQLGVNNNSTVIITSPANDASNVFLGTRLYWQLKYFGHDKVALLNGGNAKWFKEKRAQSNHSAAIKEGNFSAQAEHKELLATTADVQKSLGKKHITLIDARPQDMYLGLFYKKSYVYAAGHIPGAKSADGDIFLQHGTVKTFHQAEKIKQALQAKGIKSENETIAYCNSGHLASGLWFIEHELLGNDKAKLYDGSMHAWTKDNKRQVVSMKME